MKMRTLLSMVSCCSVVLLVNACTNDCSKCPPPADPVSDAGPQAAGWPGGKLCNTNSDCAGAAPACTIYEGTKCDKSRPMPGTNQGRCMIKLAPSKQCAEGHKHGAAAPDGTNIVIRCDTSTCDWASVGEACGAQGQPCCIGGCNGNLHCSSLVGAVGAKCN